jgi:bifunctional DNA-binding transcriptional regulator/antitoxin component of YhaV-PrlF toxin-antitoxin module
MGEQTKVLQKGKITIPADIRQKLGINKPQVSYFGFPKHIS